MLGKQSHRLCVAPMMDWTDRHDRMFLRLISRHARLYTEMVTAAALVHGDTGRLLQFSAPERPLALQLGGADLRELAMAAGLAEAKGFDEINLNIGCPSDRVQSGLFGACLMLQPERVAQCFTAMREATDLPVTVKCRIGVDDQEPETALFDFVARVAEAGCTTFIVHARKAWLKGLSPKQNREVPPLDYDLVYRLEQAWPHLTVVINGGIGDLTAAAAHLQHVDGVMLGRAAYQRPYLLADADRALFGDDRAPPSRQEIVEALLPYVEEQWRKGVRLHAMTRHMLGLFHGEPGARHWRRRLSEDAVKPDATPDLLRQALDDVLAAPARAAA